MIWVPRHLMPRRGRRMRPVIYDAMGFAAEAGQSLLLDGVTSLDAEGNRILSDGAGDGCCCQPPNLCIECLGHTCYSDLSVADIAWDFTTAPDPAWPAFVTTQYLAQRSGSLTGVPWGWSFDGFLVRSHHWGYTAMRECGTPAFDRDGEWNFKHVTSVNDGFGNLVSTGFWWGDGREELDGMLARHSYYAPTNAGRYVAGTASYSNCGASGSNAIFAWGADMFYDGGFIEVSGSWSIAVRNNNCCRWAGWDTAAVWSSSTTYAVGAWVKKAIDNGYRWRSKISSNLNHALPADNTSNAYWESTGTCAQQVKCPGDGLCDDEEPLL